MNITGPGTPGSRAQREQNPSWSSLVSPSAPYLKRRAPLPRESWEPQPPLSQHPHQNHRRVLTMSNPTNSLYHHNPGPGYHHLLLHGSATIHSSSHKTARAIFSTWIALCLLLKILKQQQPTPTELPNMSSYPAPSLMAQSIQQLSFSA